MPDRSPFSTRVRATPALLQAGLERVACIAGLQPVGDDEPAAILLRGVAEVANDANVLPDDTLIDVSTGRAHITLTIAADPGPEVWTALRALVHELLGGDARA